MRGSAKNLTCWFAATLVPLHGSTSSIGGGDIAETSVCTFEVDAGLSAALGAGVGAADLEPPDELCLDAVACDDEDELDSSVSEPPQATATNIANAIRVIKTTGMLDKFGLFIFLHLLVIG